MFHWVYRVQFVLGDLSPLLIGGAFALGRSSHRFRRDLKLLRALMPALAVMLAVRFPPAVHARLADRLEFTPVVATVAAAYAAYVYCFFLSRVLPLAIAGELTCDEKARAEALCRTALRQRCESQANDCEVGCESRGNMPANTQKESSTRGEMESTQCRENCRHTRDGCLVTVVQLEIRMDVGVIHGYKPRRGAQRG